MSKLCIPVIYSEPIINFGHRPPGPPGLGLRRIAYISWLVYQTFPPVRATDWTPVCVQPADGSAAEHTSLPKGNASAAFNSEAH